MLVIGYLACVVIVVLAIRRVDREPPGADRFTRMVDEGPDWR